MLRRQITELRRRSRHGHTKIKRRQRPIIREPAVVPAFFSIVVAVYSYRQRDRFGLGTKLSDYPGRLIGRYRTNRLQDTGQFKRAGNA